MDGPGAGCLAQLRDDLAACRLAQLPLEGGPAAGRLARSLA